MTVSTSPSPRQINMPSKVAAVVGVGPGLGLEVARKFAREGYTVAILARGYDKLTKYAEQLAEESSAPVTAIQIDCSDSRSIKEAFEAVNSLGTVEVLVYNTPGRGSPRPLTEFTEIEADAIDRSLNRSCVGALRSVQHVVRGMIERKRGKSYSKEPPDRFVEVQAFRNLQFENSR